MMMTAVESGRLWLPCRANGKESDEVFIGD
jgi:hypothetical protein